MSTPPLNSFTWWWRGAYGGGRPLCSHSKDVAARHHVRSLFGPLFDCNMGSTSHCTYRAPRFWKPHKLEAEQPSFHFRLLIGSCRLVFLDEKRAGFVFRISVRRPGRRPLVASGQTPVEMLCVLEAPFTAGCRCGLSGLWAPPPRPRVSATCVTTTCREGQSTRVCYTVSAHVARGSERNRCCCDDDARAQRDSSVSGKTHTHSCGRRGI